MIIIFEIDFKSVKATCVKNDLPCGKSDKICNLCKKYFKAFCCKIRKYNKRVT